MAHFVLDLLRRETEKILATTGLVQARAEADVEIQEEGRVHRHRARGPPVNDPRAQKKVEDERAWAGMRDPADLQKGWPELWKVMSGVADVLEAGRTANSDLRGLPGAFGDAPARPPPSEASLAELRTAVGLHLGLSEERADAHSWCSPWRHNLVRQIQVLTGDGDHPLPRWLEVGAPMGIASPIELSNGAFPESASPAALPVEALKGIGGTANHQSFLDYQGEDRPPGHTIVEDHVNAGFGMLFKTKADADKYLETSVVPAPLGCVSKRREDGTWKHRVIQDLKANRVNLASATPERQVLPTVYQHARDLAVLGEALVEGAEDLGLQTLILDFRDAFMGVPLDPAEYAYNCCGLALPVRRSREPLYDGEPTEGAFVIWVVLGFGGKPNPLVFSRAISSASRTAQGLLRPRPGDLGHPRAASGRIQMYVDDPVVTLLGDPAAIDLGADLVILWWRVLGLPLAWRKGVWTPSRHRWIGADFDVRNIKGQAAGIITVPAEFVDDLHALLEPFARTSGHVSQAMVDRVLGKCGRLSYLIPGVRPFVGAMWGALAGSRAARDAGRKEAPPGRHAARRFASSARWLRVLLKPPPGTPLVLPLEQIVMLNLTPVSLQGPRILVDASPWGGGGVLYIGKEPAEFFRTAWSPELADHLGTKIGDPSGQTTWEYLVVLLALILYGSRFVDTGVAILGDSLSALNGLLSLRGRGALTQIAREISWRRVRHGWRYAAGHLPSEFNTLADALSRLAAPAGADVKSFPQELEDVPESAVPDLSGIWACA